MTDKIFDYFSYYQWWKNLDKFLLSLIATLFLIGLFFIFLREKLVENPKSISNMVKNISGIIIGRALYEKKIKIKDAKKIFSKLNL